MLFGNPFPSHLRGSDRQAADLAGVIGPLGPVDVSLKNYLQLIAEAPFARPYGSFHTLGGILFVIWTQRVT